MNKFVVGKMRWMCLKPIDFLYQFLIIFPLSLFQSILQNNTMHHFWIVFLYLPFMYFPYNAHGVSRCILPATVFLPLNFQHLLHFKMPKLGMLFPIK